MGAPIHVGAMAAFWVPTRAVIGHLPGHGVCHVTAKVTLEVAFTWASVAYQNPDRLSIRPKGLVPSLTETTYAGDGGTRNTTWRFVRGAADVFLTWSWNDWAPSGSWAAFEPAGNTKTRSTGVVWASAGVMALRPTMAMTEAASTTDVRRRITTKREVKDTTSRPFIAGKRKDDTRYARAREPPGEGALSFSR